MSNGAALARRDDDRFSMMEKVVVQGDLSGLSGEERTAYYMQVCDSTGLNPLTKPFDYLKLNGKLTLYATRNCTDQLRKIHDISVSIAGREKVGDVYVVTARARTPGGREDESTGAVSLGNLRGDNLANALMKAETKAKRRVTLSICGLSWMDETEVETVHGAERPPLHAPVAEQVAHGDPEMAERIDEAREQERQAEQEWAPIVEGWLQDLDDLVERVDAEGLDGADELSAWCHDNGGELRRLPRRLAQKLWARLGGNKSSAAHRLGVSIDDLKGWLREAPDTLAQEYDSEGPEGMEAAQ